MRGDNHPLVTEEGKGQIGRLRIEYVERRSGEAAAGDGSPQGGMIDEPAARRVDQECGGVHLLKLAIAEKMVCRIGERCMQRDKIAPSQQLLEWDHRTFRP